MAYGFRPLSGLACVPADDLLSPAPMKASRRDVLESDFNSIQDRPPKVNLVADFALRTLATSELITLLRCACDS